MTDRADPSPRRHQAVYRTVRGTALSGSRALPGSVSHRGDPAPAAPLRISAILRVRPASELAAAVMPAAPADIARVGPEPHHAGDDCDADGLYDTRRYSEPND
jgi:hypothetical protein